MWKPFLFSFLIVFTIACDWRFVDSGKREKRFLHFPPKSNIVLTMALLKLLPTESIVNTLTEFDVLFPLPLHPFRTDIHAKQKRKLERNLIFTKLTTIAEHFSLDGNVCLRKFICVLDKSIPSTSEQEDNVLRDIIDIVFQPSVLLSEGCVNETRNNYCIFM